MKSQDFKSFLNKIDNTPVKKQVEMYSKTKTKTLQTESIPDGIESQLSYIIEQIGFIKSQLSNINNEHNYNKSTQSISPVFKENNNLQNYTPSTQTAFSGTKTQLSASLSGEPVDIMAHAGSILA